MPRGVRGRRTGLSTAKGGREKGYGGVEPLERECAPGGAAKRKGLPSRSRGTRREPVLLSRGRRGEGEAYPEKEGVRETPGTVAGEPSRGRTLRGAKPVSGRASRGRSERKRRRRAKGTEGEVLAAGGVKVSYPGDTATRMADQGARVARRAGVGERKNKGRAPLAEEVGEGKRGGRGVGPRGRVRMLLAALLVASLGAMVWVYFFTDTLNVRQVEIYGNCNLDPDYLRSISGVTPRTHLLKMDVKAVEKAVLSEPYVLRVEVRRRFPHTVVLKVVERTPIGYLVQNGRFHLVDREGLVLESKDQRGELPEITGLEMPLLYPGTRIEDPRLQGLAAILAEWPEDNGVRVKEAGYAEGEGYYLLVEGTRVIFGDQSDCRRKAEIALATIQEVAPRYGGLRYVDVTYPDHPAIRPR